MNQLDTYASMDQKLGELADGMLEVAQTGVNLGGPIRRHAGNALLANLSDEAVVWVHGDGAFGGDLRKPKGAKKRMKQAMTRFPGTKKR